jgi:hypothetical protein
VRRLALVAFVLWGCGRRSFDANDAGLDASEAVGEATLVQVFGPPYVTATSHAVAITATAGNLLIAGVFWDKAGTAVTLSDTASHVWTAFELRETTNCSTRITGITLYYAPVTTTLTTIVSATQTSAEALGLFVAEYAGLDLASPIVTTASLGAPGPTNAMTTPPLTVSDDALIVAVFADADGGGAMVPGDGWSARAIENTFYWMLVDAAPSVPAGIYTPTGYLPDMRSDACWVAAAAALRLR